MRLAEPVIGKRPRLKDWADTGVCAACFVAAHVIIQGQIVSVLTFLPGLVLGWLFIRTKSLLAPILFHGLANVCYVVTMGLFVQTHDWVDDLRVWLWGAWAHKTVGCSIE